MSHKPATYVRTVRPNAQYPGPLSVTLTPIAAAIRAYFYELITAAKRRAAS